MGEVFSAVVSASVIEVNGVPIVLAMSRDISEAKDAVERIKDLAFYDALGSALANWWVYFRAETVRTSEFSFSQKQSALIVDNLRDRPSSTVQSTLDRSHLRKSIYFLAG